jgi:hypothetical protein
MTACGYLHPAYGFPCTAAQGHDGPHRCPGRTWWS